MTNVYLNLFLICLVVVNIVDLSGFIDTLKHWIWKWVWKGKREFRDFDFRPLSCSYCMLHHLGLLYLLIAGKWTLPAYVFLLFLSYLTPIIKDLIQMVKDICIRILDMIYTYLNL